MAASRFTFGWIVVATLLAVPQAAHAQGLQLYGIGPVNRSMGGAATAAPLEAIGALHYNPATLTALPNQLSVGAEVVTPIVNLRSSFLGRSGETDSDSGWAAIPAIGLSFKPNPEGPYTVGFGLFGVAGYSVNFPASTTNPILFPQVPTATTPTPGFGNIFADVSLLQLAPTLAMQVTDHLSVAAGPTIMAGRLISSPFAFTPPNANGYPVGTGTQFAWGLGFQVGAYYTGDNCVNWGASFKSPQWFQDFRYHGVDATGLPRDFTFGLDYPMIISLGTSYTGIQNWLFACDVRYFDWANSTDTPGKDAAIAANGEVLGLGWESTWSISFGTQYKLSDMMSVRAGYAYSQSPITDDNAGINVGSPIILKQSLNLGATINLSKGLSTHMAYYYSPVNEVSGPFASPAGPVAGSNANYRVSAHGISVGMTANF
jgi:long-chain fatty acid transport protein